MSNSLSKRIAGLASRELAIRIIAAAVIVPVVLLDVWLGDTWFELGVALLGAIMASEWCRMVNQGARLQLALHAFAAVAGSLIVHDAGLAMALQIVAVCWAMSLLLSASTKRERTRWAWWGVPYIALPCIAMVMLRHSPELGLTAVLWLFAVVWSADTFAFVFGRVIGGARLAPRISPNKTWAGLGGAVFGGVAAGVLFAWLAGLGGLAAIAVIAAALAVIEQAGDLFESAVKRRFGVKDSGRLIPGHGGVLDRVDGLMFAAMAAAGLGLARDSEVVARGLLLW